MSTHHDTNIDTEKLDTDLEHQETLSQGDHVGHFSADEHSLPPGYYKTSFFWGSMTAIGLGLMAGVAGFGYAAPILGVINADIGPDANVVWVALSYTLTVAVCLTIVGRVSDIFGRRWVFIGGATLGVIGSIVCATAQNVNSLIGGTAIIGIAASTQLSYYYVMGELVPMKYRLAGNAFCYLFTLPGSGTAPAVANAFILYHPSVSWRGCYYILIAVNSVALLCWVLFYFPPTFRMKHGDDEMIIYVKKFDYIGTVLYTGGLLVLLLGLNWGGSVWPWASAHVIATIVVGFVALCIFVVWESYAKLREPLVPMYLFKNIPWLAATLVSGLAASIYYAFAIVWPQMVAVLYTKGDGSPMDGPWLSTIVGLCIVLGEIVGGFCAKSIGHIKYQTFGSLFIGGIFFASVATCTPDTLARAAALVAFGVFFIGWAESLSITMVTLTVINQNELGSASGVAGSVRFLISSVAASIYSAILSNRLAHMIPSQVGPAVKNAGLPTTSIAEFIAAFSTGSDAFQKVPGITPTILAIGTRAYQEANASAFRTVFLSTIAFTGVAIIATLFLPNVDHLLTGKVAATLHDRNNGEGVVAEK